MDEAGLSQAEDPEISSSLDVEKLGIDLFQSQNLWNPPHARGVFGGQVISQAIISATNCADPAYGLHSLHCYFILNVSPAVPVQYHVDRVRDGRSYVTRAVRAIQNKRIVFIMVCSFHKPEPWQPFRQPPMPPGIPAPELCEDEEVTFRRFAADDRCSKFAREVFLGRAAERVKSPIAVRRVKDSTQEEMLVTMFWMRAKNVPSSKRGAAYQKCILAYISDIHFISTPARAVGLKNGPIPGPKTLGLISTLDHAIWFYGDDFDCGDWLLYEMRVAEVGLGRGLVTGRMFTRNGALIAVMSQEGVLRAGVRGPQDQANTEKSKL